MGSNESHLSPERLHSFLLLFVHSVICLQTLIAYCVPGIYLETSETWSLLPRRSTNNYGVVSKGRRAGESRGKDKYKFNSGPTVKYNTVLQAEDTECLRIEA